MGMYCPEGVPPSLSVLAISEQVDVIWISLAVNPIFCIVYFLYLNLSIYSSTRRQVSSYVLSKVLLSSCIGIFYLLLGLRILKCELTLLREGTTIGSCRYFSCYALRTGFNSVSGSGSYFKATEGDLSLNTAFWVPETNLNAFPLFFRCSSIFDFRSRDFVC